MMKVMTIVGTRPEIIRLSRIIYKLDKYFESTLVHTGQNYDFELNQIFFDDLGIREPDYFLNSASDTVAQTIGKIIASSDYIFKKVKPDALLILGDTNSSLASISAKRNKIPIFHMEAGNRCFDLRVTEEINRKIVDHISDINLPYSNIAREYLIREGLPPQNIIKTGSPMPEVINYYKDKIEMSNVLKLMNLKKDNYFLVSTHREENLDNPKNFKNFINLLNNISKKYNLPVIVSTHPRTKKKIDTLVVKVSNNIKFFKPLAFTDYCKLQLNSKLVLSDSGTITEETSIMNLRSINLRSTHERPEGMEQGAVMFTGMNFESFINASSILENQSKSSKERLRLVQDYEDINVSEKIVRIISSYTDFVNKYTWYK